MARYNIEILPSVIKKDLIKISKGDNKKILEKIALLAENPRPIWSKKLSGREEYRARQGVYRILYVIDDGIKIVKVVKVGHRGSIYK